jgi:hypothetical protein
MVEEFPHGVRLGDKSDYLQNATAGRSIIMAKMPAIIVTVVIVIYFMDMNYFFLHDLFSLRCAFAGTNRRPKRSTQTSADNRALTSANCGPDSRACCTAYSAADYRTTINVSGLNWRGKVY